VIAWGQLLLLLSVSSIARLEEENCRFELRFKNEAAVGEPVWFD
jgi:hypothetical protein